MAVLGAASSLTALLVVLVMLGRQQGAAPEPDLDQLAATFSDDAVPVLITDHDGRLLWRNPAASEAHASSIDTIGAVLRELTPDPVGVLGRARVALGAQSIGHEYVSGTRGAKISLLVVQLAPGHLLWRLDNRSKQVAAESVEADLLTLKIGRDGQVLGMSAAAKSALGTSCQHASTVFAPWPIVRQQTAILKTLNGSNAVSIHTQDLPDGTQLLTALPQGAARSTIKWEAIEALPVPILRVSVDGTVCASNALARGLLGEDVTQGTWLPDLMEGLGRPIGDWLRDMSQGRLGQYTEFLRLKRVEKETFVQVSLGRVETDGRKELIAVLSDATELKSLEAQFVQSQKMQAIGQLAGGVAHDFNNLLTAISGHCDLLLLRHGETDPDHADLVQINQNANRAAALVSQLLAFSRKQTLRPKIIDMHETLADLGHLLNRLVGERVTLNTDVNTDLPPIRADKRQLEQVLMNLVVNARDAMPDGGEILVKCERRELSQPLVRDNATVPPGPYLLVKVSDEGIGIPPEMAQKVFEPFYTTKRTDEGTGLGLSTAYGIVKQTGGFIFLDSEVGRGTTFTLYLPAQTREDFAEQLSETPEEKSPIELDTGGVVLLVEDEAPVRAFASRALQLRGYTVLEADSAESALDLLTDPDLNIDVFVTDVVMPGMDGPTWVREALKTRPDTRVVFVSGYAEDSFGEAQARIPNSVFLPKPFSLGDLAETVHKQMVQTDIAA